MTRRAHLAAAVLVLAAASARAVPVNRVHSLANPTPARGDFYGASVAILSGSLAIGAPSDDTGATDAGAIHVVDPTTGSLRRTIPNPTPAAGAQFGFALVPFGTDLFVAAPHADSGAPHAGTVHRIDPATGAVRRTIPNPTPEQSDVFGHALAAAGRQLLVGAPFNDGAGGAYLFDGDTGALLRTFLPPEPEASAAFGRAVALGGGRVVIGAPLDDLDDQVNAGTVHVFDAASGAFVRTLTSLRQAAFEQFGSAVATDGNRIVVGAPFDGTVGSNAGAAHLFDAATGALVRTLVSPEPAPDARFGSAVALVGAYVIVGAPFDDLDAQNAGAVYLFDAGTGASLATLHNPTPLDGDQFGAALAASGSTFLIGAWLDDGGFRDAGAAHVFVDAGAPPTTTTTTATTSTTVTVTTATTLTTATGTTIAPATTTATTTTSTTRTTAAATTTTSTAPRPTASLPSTTGTTIPNVPSLPTCGPLVCDDGDPCTIDDCASDGSCRHVAPEGHDAVLCRLDSIEGFLRAASPFTFGGPRAAKRLQRKMVQVRRLVAATRTAKGKKGLRQLRRAERLLGTFGAAVRTSERRGRMVTSVADKLAALAADAAGQLAPLRTALGG